MTSNSAQATSSQALRERLAEAADAEAAFDHGYALEAFRLVADAAQGTELGLEAARKRADLLLKLGRNDEAATAFDALIVACEALAATTSNAPTHIGPLAGALAERAHVAYRSGDGPAILAFSERAVAIARQAASPALVAHALRYVGIAHEFAGRHSEAERSYLELLEIAPDTRHLGPVCNSLGEIARAAGRFGSAVMWYRRFLEEWRKTHGDEPNIVYLNNMGAALVELGQPAQGRVLLDRAIEEQRRSGLLAMLSETYHYRALSRLLEGATEAAARDVAEGYMLALELGESEMMGVLLRLLARIRQRERRLNTGAGPGAPAETHAVASDGASPSYVTASEGTPLELLRKSIAILEAAGKPAEVAKSRWLLGEIYDDLSDASASETELAAAHDVFVTLGLDHWAEMVARAQASSLRLS